MVVVNNKCIRRRQIRSPGASEIKVALDEGHQSRKTAISLAAGFTKEHRTPRYKNLEFTRPASRASMLLPRWHIRGSPVGYLWRREVRVPISDIFHYWNLAPASFLSNCERGGDFQRRRPAILLDAGRFRQSLEKCRGGAVIEFVGYSMDFVRFSVGVSGKRAQWMKRTLDDFVSKKCVLVRTAEAHMERSSFAFLAFDHQRTLTAPAPFYAWLAVMPRGILCGTTHMRS